MSSSGVLYKHTVNKSFHFWCHKQYKSFHTYVGYSMAKVSLHTYVGYSMAKVSLHTYVGYRMAKVSLHTYVGYSMSKVCLIFFSCYEYNYLSWKEKPYRVFVPKIIETSFSFLSKKNCFMITQVDCLIKINTDLTADSLQLYIGKMTCFKILRNQHIIIIFW